MVAGHVAGTVGADDFPVGHRLERGGKKLVYVVRQGRKAREIRMHFECSGLLVRSPCRWSTAFRLPNGPIHIGRGSQAKAWTPTVATQLLSLE